MKKYTRFILSSFDCPSIVVKWNNLAINLVTSIFFRKNFLSILLLFSSRLRLFANQCNVLECCFIKNLLIFELINIIQLLTFEWTRHRNSWALDGRVGRWTLDAGLWTLDAGRWTLKTLEARLWALGIGCWILDVKTLRSTVNPFQANVLFLFNHLKISKTRGFQRFSDDMESKLQLEMNYYDLLFLLKHIQ